MSCSPFDLRDYLLQELTGPEQHQVDVHVKTCSPCREELDRLRVTQVALLSVPDEEIPQRIAFVSDKIFEPSPWRRWLSGFWGSASQLGFASAAMLSAAVVVYALRPAPVVQVAVSAKPPQTIVQTVSDAEIQARIDAAVARLASGIEARQEQKTQVVMADLKSMQQQFNNAIRIWDIDSRRQKVLQMASSQYGDPHDQQEPK